MGVTFVDNPPTDQDVLQIIKAVFAQQWISRPSVLC
jgi:hypothetical protein